MENNSMENGNGIINSDGVPQRWLTKSLFTHALNCPTKAYYKQNHQTYQSTEDENGFLQALAEGGIQVGELAQHYFPGGRLIEYSRDKAKSLDETNALLEQDSVIIFEAAIAHENCYSLVDVFVKEGNVIKLIEVKSKSWDQNEEFLTKNGKRIQSPWQKYLYDIAFQTWIAKKAFPNYEIEPYLMLIDKNKAVTVDGLHQNFEIYQDENGRSHYDTWFESTIYTPSSLSAVINDGYRWDQSEFWSSFNTYFIYHNGDGSGADMYVLDNVLHENIVILPQTSYSVNSAEYKRKPYLGFDQSMLQSTFGAELDLVNPGTDGRIDGDNGGFGLTNALVDAGSFVTGVEYNIREVGDTDFTLIGASQNVVNTVFTATGPGTGTGKARETDGIIVSHDTNPIPIDDIHPSLMQVFDNRFYHPDFQPNGYLSSHYSGTLPTDWSSFPSSRRFDLSIAKFEVTVSGGVVTAITGVNTLDGDGNPVNGGWDYYDSNDYTELSFTSSIEYSSTTQLAPRILFRTSVDQVGYSGNKATVNIADSTTEFFAGKDLTDGTYDAWALKGGAGLGFANVPDVTVSYDDWYNVNLPRTILPRTVAVTIERPILKSITRSLKEVRVGTGAHRMSFDFEYPPMTSEEADDFIAFFELAKGGARDVQIFIPYIVMPNTESLFYNVDLDVASSRLFIESGKAIGSDEMVISGLQPGYGARLNFRGIYFNLGDKVYRITDATNVDDYGRCAIKFEPPLLSTDGSFIRGRTTNDTRGQFFALRAKLVDDTLDYSVDSAGLYRLRFKFVESL